ncbi:hypothetical protein ABKV19_004048 [Rosa sericea]
MLDDDHKYHSGSYLQCVFFFNFEAAQFEDFLQLSQTEGLDMSAAVLKNLKASEVAGGAKEVCREASQVCESKMQPPLHPAASLNQLTSYVV